jgi:hypothetical protein
LTDDSDDATDESIVSPDDGIICQNILSQTIVYFFFEILNLVNESSIFIIRTLY